ncbi:hypothetical protein [Sphingomonas adhaesiva]|jgi:hypothetical protein|uniref:Uncharacterized protein n=1 Tax=Sphingomonas adhaesiva TaxID=28212 RepID=A0A2A4I364_9SPHN|nr:hypothetical protein [Sphingomonas adhaesiva]PCG13081.1 hypothetical protein COA07_16340 [Sphingomonas adhaesiva]
MDRTLDNRPVLPIEDVELWFGPANRLVGRKDSAALAQVPHDVYPNPVPACAACPAMDWYLTRKSLRCFCTAKNVIAWVSDEDPVLVCDTRERLIEEETEDGAGVRSRKVGDEA